MSATKILVPDYIRVAVASDRRSKADKKRDANRKPAELLAYYEIEPGQKVAEFMAGGCYVTSILAGIVGDAGVVYATNSQQLIDRFKGSPVRKLIERHDLANVVELISEPDDPGLPAGELDAVFSFMIYHDMVWVGTDRSAMNAAVFRSLKPGGLYAVMDHHAPDGAGISVVQTTHRIEKNVVIDEVCVAGFELEDETDILENSDDPMDAMVHEKAIRDRTHRFVLKFRKPA
jgi:predicted methyltransferase